MSLSFPALNKALAAVVTMGALSLSTVPASADFFELSYATSIGTGNIFFTILPTGSGTGGISHAFGTETITSNSVADTNMAQSITGVAPAGYLAAQGLALTGQAGPNNDNLVVKNPNSPGANLGNWFSSGGLGFIASDGTLVGIYDVGGKLREYALDSGGGQATSNPLLPPYSATLTDFGAPGPVPGNGLSALAMLAGLALIAKLRGFVVR